MEENDIKVGTMMLKSIIDHGGEATTKQIGEDISRSLTNVNSSGLALKGRGLVRKRIDSVPAERHPGLVRRNSIWSIREQKKEKVNQLIRIGYGESWNQD